MAAMHRRIHTDRLHFAVAGLMVGTEVVLYPNSYHKNREVYDLSLKRLGCKFSES
jgi:exopolysaccharide biosynthesis predicted pyruvyltransferase EpsI